VATITVLRSGRRVLINEFVVETAPTISELYGVLGRPTRIDSGEQLAPVGHRNNQTHVYDDSGLTINEHH